MWTISKTLFVYAEGRALEELLRQSVPIWSSAAFGTSPGNQRSAYVSTYIDDEAKTFINATHAARQQSASQQTMISDIDIWRAANQLIKQYDDLADIEAAARADGLEAKGDREGQRAWLRILKAIDALRTAGTTETRH